MPLGLDTGNEAEAHLAELQEALETWHEQHDREMELREFDPKPARGERIEQES